MGVLFTRIDNELKVTEMRTEKFKKIRLCFSRKHISTTLNSLQLFVIARLVILTCVASPAASQLLEVLPVQFKNTLRNKAVRLSSSQNIQNILCICKSGNLCKNQYFYKYFLFKITKETKKHWKFYIKYFTSSLVQKDLYSN